MVGFGMARRVGIGEAIMWGGLFGLIAAMLGKKKTDDGGRDPEGGKDPPPGGELELDGGPDPRIVNLLNESPTEKRKRDRADAWAAVLHQMGFARGNDPMRYRKVTAQYIITPNGTIAQLHPIRSKLNSSDGFNEGGISIEFAGNFPSVSGSTDPRDFWHPFDWVDKNGKKRKGFGMDQLTPEQIKSGRYLLLKLQTKILPAQDKMLTHVLAHRQSAGEKSNDPGPDVWRFVGQWGVDVRDLSDGGQGFKVGDGNAIPEIWREGFAEA
jgi:hypothetical protein